MKILFPILISLSEIHIIKKSKMLAKNSDFFNR